MSDMRIQYPKYAHRAPGDNAPGLIYPEPVSDKTDSLWFSRVAHGGFAPFGHWGVFEMRPLFIYILHSDNILVNYTAL